ncbi:hypothetical protein EB796_017344 [Bugula neritina]|uniref:SH3 domain-containing protein n=1 Tax=Bugula neritina TaxID=10212 RepID=A0A7J7JES9_BUGNE|nr:hypothetical protein EB796_017344 [Bugula neritina]
MLSHSTPKFVNKVLSRKGKIEQYLSPIVLDLDDHAGNNEVTSQPSTPAAHEKSNSESTVTLGTSEATPVISQSNAPRGRDKLSSTEGSSLEKAGDSKPHGKARVSPLQNKSSLQKMIKSLASKEKSRNGVDKRDDEIDSRLSQRQSEKSGERKTRHQRKTEPKARRGNIEVSARQFKALYDYDPAIMSPNKNAENEELPFRAEDVILVFGEADADGFYIGEIGNRRGLVPGNLVIEINVDNELKKGERKMHAAYDYDPKQLSPNKNCEEELSFKQGDTLIVKGDMDEDGFYMGYVAGNKDRTGLVPSNFLRPIANNL